MNKKGLIFLIYTQKRKGELDRCQCKRRLKIVFEKEYKKKKRSKKNKIERYFSMQEKKVLQKTI